METFEMSSEKGKENIIVKTTTIVEEIDATLPEVENQIAKKQQIIADYEANLEMLKKELDEMVSLRDQISKLNVEKISI